ncbi:MAG: prepilin-type N-terminal cleavage/methylation domain-containing protein [Desulfobacteraceae bacterium]|nr:prepilin-type N-terminal cleavage/methylation domain-containing protein [Desulfobacteraceae bacterium]MCF8035633.1 prepilin-type N-terminal cleavage/methylation domain-containing protein [Desulfobacteraceae bacterium]
MQQAGKNEQGFTLIETIAVILLVGVISAVLGMAIVQGVKSYVFGRTNVVISQKAQLALARMDRELRAITEIDDTNSDDKCIRYKRETAALDFRTIGMQADSVRINVIDGSDAPCPSAGDQGSLLLDNVSSFTLQYEDDQGNMLTNPPALLENLRAIHIELTVSRIDSGRTESFSVVISPRNTGLPNAPGSSG